MSGPMSRTSLAIASINGHLSAVSVLIEMGEANVNCDSGGGINAVFLATNAEHLDVLGYLLDHGGDINSEYDLGTILTWSVYRGKLKIIRFLIARNVPVDRKSTIVSIFVRGSFKIKKRLVS